MHQHLIALAVHHAHQQGFQNGPMDSHWLTIGLCISIGGAILIAGFGAIGRRRRPA